MLHLGALRGRFLFLSYKVKSDVQAIFRASTATSTPGEEQARGTRMIKVTNVVYHDKAHPSALTLLIVP